MADITLDNALSGADVLMNESTTGSGTGAYDSFVRIQANGDEDGFNTDTTHVLDNKDGVWTHSIKFSALQTINVGGVDYYEIRLDLNEGNAKAAPLITLADLELFYSAVAPTTTTAGLTKVFDLNAAQLLTDINQGSGTDDYQLLVPKSLFASAGANDYFTLYASFTSSDGGFEEFRVLPNTSGGGGGPPPPSMSIEKTGVIADAGTAVDSATDVINYSITVTNTGGIALTNVVVTDPYADSLARGVDVVGNNDSVMDVGEVWSYTASHQVTQGEIDAYGAGETDGLLRNTAYADSDQTDQISDEWDEPIELKPGIHLVKTAQVVNSDLTVDSDQKAETAGDVINYTLTVTNTGNVALSGVGVNDPMLGGAAAYVSGDTDLDGKLDVNETWIFGGSYIVTQTDLDLGGVDCTDTLVNTATASGSVLDLPPVTDDDTATVELDINPSIDLTKSVTTIKNANGTTDSDQKVDTAGDKIFYHFTITNDGNTALGDVVFTDLGLDSWSFTSKGDNDSILSVGETWVIDGVKTVTQGMIDAAVAGNYTIDNHASVTADDHCEDEASDTADASVGVAPGPGVRTPGFWASSNGKVFWDGLNNNNPKAGTEGFAKADVLYAVDNNNDGTVDGKTGLLIGDWDRDGKQDNGETTIYVSLTEANDILNASAKTQGDARWVLGRDMVATWLNFLAGNGVGADPPNTLLAQNSPKQLMNDALHWMLQYGDKDGDHHLELNGDDKSWVVKTTDAKWYGSYEDGLSAANYHTMLDYYNNTGIVGGFQFAPPEP